MNWVIIVLLIAVIIVFVILCQKNGGIINTIEMLYQWYQRQKLIQERKNRKAQIQSDIARIQETKIQVSDKRLNFITKPAVKKKFESSKEKIDQYIQFCESNNLILRKR